MSTFEREKARLELHRPRHRNQNLFTSRKILARKKKHFLAYQHLTFGIKVNLLERQITALFDI